MGFNINENGPMLNAYPDSMGGNLADILSILKKEELKDIFSSFYILPSLFNTDLDRGFSVISYDLNEVYADKKDLSDLKDLGIDLKLDFILNHASVLSEQFQDIIKNGQDSKYADFFINWNKFWANEGVMNDKGYIEPKKEHIEKMFFRKPGLPILMVTMPDGSKVPYWNTFYQEVKYPKLDAQDLMRLLDIQYIKAESIAHIVNEELSSGKAPEEMSLGKYAEYLVPIAKHLDANRKYLGQMDLNIKSDLVWEFYDETLRKLSEYGASIVRLDAFAYAPKEVGEKNFLNEPGTWEVLERVRQLADKYNLRLLPEIHASYSEKNYEMIADKGYMTYDFFLPGLLIDAIERNNGDVLKAWANELYEKKIRVVNMLGCHDGIPLLDLKGLIPDERIENLIDITVARGGYVKNLHGQKNMYYQVNATYYSALGEDDKKFLFARALQMFMPGKPQVWYLDLLAGKNDYEAMERAGAGGHKEINRSNLSLLQVDEKLKLDIVKEQLRLLHFRKTCKAFAFDADFNLSGDGDTLTFTWEKDGYKASLFADFKDYSFTIEAFDNLGNRIDI